jgi:hypothetical protein
LFLSNQITQKTTTLIISTNGMAASDSKISHKVAPVKIKVLCSAIHVQIAEIRG